MSIAMDLVGAIRREKRWLAAKLGMDSRVAAACLRIEVSHKGELALVYDRDSSMFLSNILDAQGEEPRTFMGVSLYVVRHNLPACGWRGRGRVVRDWQADAPREIARIHAEMPEATPDELRKALRRHSSQFSYGTSWGVKVWAKHCRTYLARMSGRGDYRGDGRATVWPADIHFPFRTVDMAPKP